MLYFECTFGALYFRGRQHFEVRAERLVSFLRADDRRQHLLEHRPVVVARRTDDVIATVLTDSVVLETSCFNCFSA